VSARPRGSAAAARSIRRGPATRNPAAALDRIAELIGFHGVLFSHVPNEYRLGHILKVMLDRGGTVQFHNAATEWEDPHFRRFSDIGYQRFLSRRFAHNLKLSDLRYGRLARLVGVWVEEPVVQFGGEGVDFAGELGVGFEFEFLFGEVVVGFGLLECGLPVLADHDEGGQEDRFEGHDQGQGRPG